MERVPAPWVLKPRSEASAIGIKKMHAPDEVWRTLEQLGDRQSFYLLERFVPGDIFHVDSIVSEGAGGVHERERVREASYADDA